MKCLKEREEGEYEEIIEEKHGKREQAEDLFLPMLCLLGCLHQLWLLLTYFLKGLAVFAYQETLVTCKHVSQFVLVAT